MSDKNQEEFIRLYSSIKINNICNDLEKIIGTISPSDAIVVMKMFWGVLDDIERYPKFLEFYKKKLMENIFDEEMEIQKNTWEQILSEIRNTARQQ